MPRVFLTQRDGTVATLELAAGARLMQSAKQHGVDGILGDCGGNLACATCHVYVKEEFLLRLPPPSETEATMLEFTAAERQPNSRLSCQIEVTDALDGLVAVVADPQV